MSVDIILSIAPRADDTSEQLVTVHQEGELPEYGQIWVWDMLYAQQLYALGECDTAAELSETLELWAVNMSSKVFQPRDHVSRKGHDRLHAQLDLKLLADATPSDALAHEEKICVSIHGQSGELPRITVNPDILPATTRFWLVLAVAQHFIQENPLFARELPIHVLAFRKYHADVEPGHSATAAEQAPFYAIEKALKYFQSASQNV